MINFINTKYEKSSNSSNFKMSGTNEVLQIKDKKHDKKNSQKTKK